MKTRSEAPLPNAYDLPESLWGYPDACAVWMLYDAAALEPINYYVLGLPMPPIERFPLSKKRAGFRGVKMQQANHQWLNLGELAALLFPGVTGL